MESEFGPVIDALPGLVFTSLPDGYVDFLNRRWLEYTGLSQEQAIGQGWQVALHPDDTPRAMEYVRARLAAGEAGEIEARLRRFDGVYRWFHFRFAPVKDAAGQITKWCGINTDIEDLKRAEEAAQMHERRFRSIIEGLPAVVTLMTPEGEFAYGNQHMIDYLGAPFEELKARPTTQSFHPEDRLEVDRRWKHSVETGEPYDHEARLKGGDGVYRWFHTRGFPVRDPDGRIALWYLLQENIDDRRRADDALRASEQNARAIVDGFPGLVAVYSHDGFLQQVNQQVVAFWGKNLEELKNWDAVGVLHPEDTARMLDAFGKAFASRSAFELEVRGRRFDGVYRWLLSRGIPVKDANGRIVRWYNLLIDIDERKRIEETLAASERNLKLIIDSTPALIWILDAKGRAESVNQTYADYVGLPLEPMPRQGWEYTHPDDLDRLIADWKALIASGGTGQTEARFRRHDGIYRWFLFRASPMRDDRGNIVRWYGVATDIEDRKQAEEALAKSERNLKLIIDTTPALIWTAAPDGTPESVNQHWIDYAGASWNPKATIFHPDDQKALAKSWKNLLSTGKPGETEVRLRRHDGEYRWFLSRANPLRDDKGNIVKWYGVDTDIEDRKRAESELRRAHGHLSEAQRLSKTGSFTADTHRDEHVWSDELYRIFEVDPAATIKIQLIRDRTHHEDLSILETAIQRGIDGTDDVDFVVRLVLPSGVLKYVHVVAHRIGDVVERPVFFGAIQDITDAKLTEEALRRSEAFLAQGEAVSETGSFFWRVETNEIRWSNALYRIFEFEPGSPVSLDRIGTSVYPEDLPLLADMVSRAESGRDFEYEHRLSFPDGRIKHIHLVAHAVRQPDGRVEYIGAAQNITGRRQADQALSKVRSELAHVARVSALGALTASIAHEVNQPLSGIITNASTCLRMLGADPPNIDGARETARRTIRDGNRAAEVITRLRALFSKKEALVEQVDLNEAVREVVALSVNELRRSRVVLRQEFADDLPLVAGDRVQLQQVVLNLILNATDAMSDVDDRVRQLTIKTELDEDDRLRLSVRDSGIGIDPVSASTIFDAFYTTKPGGMGIGLSVSRSIIDRHQGRLWARSNEGPGATFSFSIPCGARHAESSALRTSAATDREQSASHH